jgi:acylphosphatase
MRNCGAAPFLHFVPHQLILIQIFFMHARVHILVEGLVQGVGFRWFVLRRAEAAGIKGWVKNLYNGKVEIEAEADRSLLEEFIKEIKVGPRSAHVTNLRIEWKENKPQESDGFEVR